MTTTPTPFSFGEGAAENRPGTVTGFTFNLRGASLADRVNVEQTVQRLVEEHNSPQKIIYTTLTGRDADTGQRFAEVTLLPIGDTIRVTLGSDEASEAARPSEMKRVATYLFTAYMALVYELPMEDIASICDLADQEAETESETESEQEEPRPK